MLRRSDDQQLERPPRVRSRRGGPFRSRKRSSARASRPTAASMCPAKLERRPDAWWKALRGKSFPDVAIAMASELAGDEFDPDTDRVAGARRAELSRARRRARDADSASSSCSTARRSPSRISARACSRGCWPSARLASRQAAPCGRRPLTILVATSGDTGSAVAHAFLGVTGHPRRRAVSGGPGQRRAGGAVHDARRQCDGGRGEGNVRRLPASGQGSVRRPAVAGARAADVGEFDQPRPAAAADVLLRLRRAAVQGARRRC